MGISAEVNLAIFLQIFSYFGIDDWSCRKQFIVCLVIGLLLVTFGYGVDINFLQHKLKVVRQQENSVRILLQRKQRAAQTIKTALLKDLSPLARFQIVTAMPRAPNLEVINIFDMLARAAYEAQIEPCLFEPQAVREHEWLMVYPIKLVLEGPYKNLILFINKLLLSSYIVVITDMAMEKKSTNNGAINNGDILKVQMLLMVYKNKALIPRELLNKLGVERTLHIPIPERDIFKRDLDSINLYLWSSRELRFLGVIKHAKKICGIVSDPFGAIHRVVVGDKISLNQSKIIAIDEHGIVTTNAADNIYHRGT